MSEFVKTMNLLDWFQIVLCVACLGASFWMPVMMVTSVFVGALFLFLHVPQIRQRIGWKREQELWERRYLRD